MGVEPGPRSEVWYATTELQPKIRKIDVLSGASIAPNLITVFAADLFHNTTVSQTQRDPQNQAGCTNGTRENIHLAILACQLGYVRIHQHE